MIASIFVEVLSLECRDKAALSDLRSIRATLDLEGIEDVKELQILLVLDLVVDSLKAHAVEVLNSLGESLRLIKLEGAERPSSVDQLREA